MKTLALTFLILLAGFTGYGTVLGALILMSPKSRLNWDHEDFNLWVKCLIVTVIAIIAILAICGVIP